jgi:hypothetical protein
VMLSLLAMAEMRRTKKRGLAIAITALVISGGWIVVVICLRMLFAGMRLGPGD